MHSSKSKGFTLPELMVSVAILGILSTGAWVTMSRAKFKDELYNASRALASDLRSAQANALNSTNVKFCSTVDPILKNVCETSLVGCTGACIAEPPATTGIRLAPGGTSYDMYAQNDVQSGDMRGRSPQDIIFTRKISDLGAPNVTVQSYIAVPPDLIPPVPDSISVAFLRQNGNMKIDVCPGCVPANDLTITLVHGVTGLTTKVKMNAITGRITTEL